MLSEFYEDENTNDKRQLYDLACNYKAMEDYNGAIKLFKEALKKDADYFDALNNLGNTYAAMGQYDEADKYLSKAFKLKPNEPIILNNYSICLMEIGKLEEAYKGFIRALKINPLFYQAYNNLGKLFAKKNELISAIKCHQKAFEINQNDFKTKLLLEKNTEIINNLNQKELEKLNLIFVNKLKTAEEKDLEIIFNQMKSQNKNDRIDSIMLCKKGIEEKQKGNFENALKFFAEAQLADYTNKEVYYNFSKLHIGFGNNDEAMRNLLVYLHISIFNNTSIDPITGQSQFKNLLEFENIDPLKQQKYLKNLELFNYINKYGTNVVTNTIVIQGELIKFLCLTRPPLQLCVLDNNISFYAGFIYVTEKKIVQIFNDINEDELIDLKNGLISKHTNNLIRNTNKEKLCYVLGLVYLAINLGTIKNIVDIPSYYLNKDRAIKKDIENLEKYLY